MVLSLLQQFEMQRSPDSALTYKEEIRNVDLTLTGSARLALCSLVIPKSFQKQIK